MSKGRPALSPSNAVMNNSETHFSIKAVKVEEVICVLRRIIGQLFFFFLLSVGRESYGLSFQRVLAVLQREPQYFSKTDCDFEGEPGLCTTKKPHIFSCFLSVIPRKIRNKILRQCTMNLLKNNNVYNNVVSPPLSLHSLN